MTRFHKSYLVARFAALASLAIASSALAGITYTESVNGDFSGNGLAPSALTLGSGSNLISGNFGSTTPTSDTLDLDYVTLTIPAGLQLTNLFVTNANVGGGASFIGFQAGTQVTVDPFDPIAGPLLGYSVFPSTSLGSDILPEMSVALGAQGFPIPLGPGQYTFWIQELNTLNVYSYGFDFRVRAIPEPTTAVVLPAAAVLLRRRRRA